ncbi:hypothetical protein SAMN04487897_10973 [Paenibacillus sp. yr247]|nr:hypothetical protein SAMN04487897_10973 [Paenibacillus sp. yr247]
MWAFLLSKFVILLSLGGGILAYSDKIVKSRREGVGDFDIYRQL